LSFLTTIAPRACLTFLFLVVDVQQDWGFSKAFKTSALRRDLGADVAMVTLVVHLRDRVEMPHYQGKTARQWRNWVAQVRLWVQGVDSCWVSCSLLPLQTLAVLTLIPLLPPTTSPNTKLKQTHTHPKPTDDDDDDDDGGGGGDDDCGCNNDGGTGGGDDDSGGGTPKPKS
jgi:hypothetical protein